MSSLTRVQFGQEYSGAYSYDLVNEEFDNTKIASERYIDKDTTSRHESIFFEFKNFNDVLKRLNIDISQKLSYLTGMCQQTPFIKYCLDQNNFNKTPNIIKYCILFKMTKNNYKLFRSPYSSSKGTLEISSVESNFILIAIVSIQEEFNGSTINVLMDSICNYVSGTVDMNYYKIPKFIYQCFDNIKSESLDLTGLKSKYTDMIYNKDRRYIMLKITLKINENITDTTYKDLHVIFEKLFYEVESLKGDYNQFKHFLNAKEEKNYQELIGFPNYLKALRTKVLNDAGKAKEKVFEFMSNIQTMISKIGEKMVWFNYFKRNSVYILRDGESIPTDKSIILFYSETEKEKNNDYWKQLIGEIASLTNKKEHKVVACDLDIYRDRKLYGKTMGLYIYQNGQYMEWSLDLKQKQDYTKTQLSNKNHYEVAEKRLEKLQEKKTNNTVWDDEFSTTKNNEEPVRKQRNSNDINSSSISFEEKGKKNDYTTNKQAYNHEQYTTTRNNEDNKVNATKQQKASRDKGNDINILLLGESGVGKSTFINAIFNYIKFNSLEDAERSNEIIHKIGATFTFTDENYKIRRVNIGNEDVNECEKEGQSSTQNAKAHEIELESGITLRIIDTPGMGDTRGIKVDQENFKRTVEYIGQFAHLNAICFLMKPNNARFGPIFKYCFKELFSNLHKNATNNIFFCFTNSRSTSYRPGDTLPALTNFLREIKDVSNVDIETSHDNMFCFDNESFRYLILSRKKYLQLIPEEKKAYKVSWEKSSSEAQRMLEAILDKKPLNTRDIIVVNQSKTFLMDWSKQTVEAITELVKCKLKLQTFNGSTSYRKVVGHYDHNLNIQISSIIETISLITVYLQQNSVAVFNDNFDAALMECIQNYEKREYIQRSEDPSVRLLNDIRNAYKEALMKSRSSRITENEYNMTLHKLLNNTLKESKDWCEKVLNKIS